jgi:hypothetical protein
MSNRDVVVGVRLNVGLLYGSFEKQRTTRGWRRDSRENKVAVEENKVAVGETAAPGSDALFLSQSEFMFTPYS